jgi:two-component system chemotaxis sensor kinase CheA
MGKADPRDYFKEEARELLGNIEQMLVDLETSPDDFELLNNIFRALHTIKGSGSMFGFEDIAEFTHDVETLFDMLRDKKLSVTKEIIDLTLSARDLIAAMLEKTDEEEVDQEEKERLLRAFKSLTTSGETSEAGQQPASQEQAESAQAEGGNRTYRIVFKPHKEIFLRGVKILPLFGELKALGSCMIMAHVNEIPPLEELDSDSCYTSWTILLTTDSDENAIRDVFIFVEDSSDIKIDVIDEEDRLDIDEDYKRIGEILFEQGHIKQEDIDSVISKKERFGEIAVEKGILSEDKLETALEEQKYVRERRKQRREVSTSSTIRVQSTKLDDMVNLVGELVTLQARLRQYTETQNGGEGHTQSELDTISETFERLTSELRDNTMNIRMVPLGETFNSFHRLVRDLSNDLGKEVELSTYGSETELDKNVIDELKDPLVHIIRNSVDHGIETPDERKEKGKPPKGTVTIGAEHMGANVLIKIVDDGKGLDPEKIRERSIQKGIISADADLSEKEILSLIFAPGFSTAETATSVSGRGVGMDVVKKNIERLRGSVNISTDKDEGTTISLTIPLTLSIIDGLLVSLDSERYIINLSAVDECFDLTEELLKSTGRNDYINIRDKLIPFIDLRNLFNIDGEFEGIRQLVVVKGEDQKLGLIVDSVLGQHQTVIKPLSAAFKNIEEISGSTILGDGTIALILDVNKIAQLTS